MSGTRNGNWEGGWLQSGGRTGNKADRAGLRWQKGCLMVHLGYSLGNAKSGRPLCVPLDWV